MVKYLTLNKNLNVYNKIHNETLNPQTLSVGFGDKHMQTTTTTTTKKRKKNE